MNLESMRNKVKEMTKDSRYLHILGVEEVAHDLAVIYGCDTEKVSAAAILHDVAKNLPVDVQIAECEKYGVSLTEFQKQRSVLIHAKLGVAYATELFHITDQEILDGISYHTTGRPSMTLLEKIVFVADFIEPSRIPLPKMDEIRWAAYNDIDLAITMIIRNTLEYLEERGFAIDTLTKETYDYYKALLSNRERKG